MGRGCRTYGEVRKAYRVMVGKLLGNSNVSAVTL
jgi:hypothetical protein